MESYPDFKPGEAGQLYLSFSESDQTHISDFFLYCKASCNERKAKDIRRILIQFRHITGTGLDNLTISDLRRFLVLLNQSRKEPWTKHDIKAYLKRFLKWRFKDWSERFDGLRELRGERTGVNEKKINAKTLLKKDEIQTIMEREQNFEIKTFFIALYESGMRPSELRTLKWQDVAFNIDADVSEINVFMTKNKTAKTTFIKEATFYLRRLQFGATSDYIFPSRENNNVPISDNTATRWINTLGRHIGRRIYPYLLRHTRAQELYTLVDENKLAERIVQKFLGHSKSMMEIYSKLNTKVLKEAVTKTIYKVAELPEEKKHELELKIDLLLRKNEILTQHFPAISELFATDSTIEELVLELKRRNGTGR
ncbi:MAG: tyrosine-type recombinase/integrase [Limisphaerales bacterium]